MSLTITPLTRTLVVYLIEGEVNTIVVVNKCIQIYDVEVKNGDCLLTINGLNFIGKDQLYINEYLVLNKVRYIDKDLSIRNIMDVPLVFYMSDRRCIKNTNAIIIPTDKSRQQFDIIPAESFITFIHDREWFMYTDIVDVNNKLLANKVNTFMNDIYFIEADDDRQINRQYELQATYLLNKCLSNSTYNKMRLGVDINTYNEINCIVRQTNRVLSNSKPIILPDNEGFSAFSVIPKDSFIISIHNEAWYTFMKKATIDELLTKYNNKHFMKCFQYLRKDDILNIQLQHKIKADYDLNKKRRTNISSTMSTNRIESHNSNNRHDNMSHERIIQHRSSNIVCNMPLERIEKQRRDDRIESQTESQQLKNRKRKRNNELSSTTKRKKQQRNLSENMTFEQNERHRVINTIEGVSSERLVAMTTRQFTLQRSRDILLKQQNVLNDRLGVVMARKARLKFKSLNLEWNKVCQYCSYVHLSSSTKSELSLCCANNKMNMIQKFNLVPLSNEMIGLFMNHIQHFKDCDIYYNNKLSLAVTGNCNFDIQYYSL